MTHSLEQAAAIIVGDSTPTSVTWVARRLCRGDFTGYKAGRKWRMTDADIDAAIESLRPNRVEQIRAVPEYAPAFSSMTSRSRRKLVAG